MLVLGTCDHRNARPRTARTGRYDSTVAPSEPQPPEASPSPEVDHRVPTASTPGRSLVTRRAVVDIVRTATLGSYGVSGLTGGGVIGRLLERLGLAQPGIRVSFGGDDADRAGGPGSHDRADAADLESVGRPTSLAAADRRPALTVELDLTVAYGVPVAEVARQVDSAVRYAVRRALGIEVDRLTIRVDGLRVRAGDLPAKAAPADPNAVAADDLAASGTDVA
jgi:uncharacterized alkaline shock family protein YloU